MLESVLKLFSHSVHGFCFFIRHASLLLVSSGCFGVMHEPMPEVFFTAFGASTLDHELRLYVRELRDRSRTVDELHRTIDQLCRDHDINSAFNQLEVHLHNEKGDEVTEVKRDYKGDDPTPAVG